MTAPPRPHRREETYDPAVRVLPPDGSWALRFEREAARLRAALGPLAVRIEHVGSTAVSGLASTPVLDVQVSVAALEPADAVAMPLARLGYADRGRVGPRDAPRAGGVAALDELAPAQDEPVRLFVKPPDPPHALHLRVCLAGGAHERRQVALRDFLRCHPEEAAAYAQLKRRLVASRPLDRAAYARGKAEFVVELERRALLWASATRHPLAAPQGR